MGKRDLTRFRGPKRGDPRQEITGLLENSLEDEDPTLNILMCKSGSDRYLRCTADNNTTTHITIGFCQQVH